MKKLNISKTPVIVLFFVWQAVSCYSQQNDQATIDKNVKAFLDKHSSQWYDMNVPASDGKLLFDLILENNYQHALEIGT